MVELGDVLVALFEEEDSHALYFLRMYGLARFDVLECVATVISLIKPMP